MQKSLPARVMESPGYHYIFFDQDSIIQEQFAGYQNVEQQVPVNSNTSFRAFSITKTFTAVGVMQLVENGLIDIDAPIQHYIAEYKFSEDVTIRHLLNHQSGIGNPIPLRWTHLKEDHDSFQSSQFADSLIKEALELKRKPGTKFSYSNINYLVLGRLIEEVTGENYEAYISDNIIAPLGLTNEMGFDYPEENQATGYHKNSFLQNLILGMLLDLDTVTYPANEKWRGFHPFYLNGAAYGGLFSNAAGLMGFGQALLSKDDQLLAASGVDLMFSNQRVRGGKLTGMSLGWFVGTIHEAQYVHHAGGGGGYYAELRIYPELGVGSVVMMNSSGMKDHRILDQLDESFIRSKMNR